MGGFVAVYLALLAASWGSGALLLAERALSASALSVMSALGDPSLRRRVEVTTIDTQVLYDFSLSAPGGVQRAAAKHPFHAQNLVLFAALVLVSPGLTPRSRAMALGVGLAAIFAVDTGIVIGDLLSMEDARLDLAGEDSVWTSLRLAASALRYSQPTGGAFMAPVFVWALLFLAIREKPA